MDKEFLKIKFEALEKENAQQQQMIDLLARIVDGLSNRLDVQRELYVRLKERTEALEEIIRKDDCKWKRTLKKELLNYR